MIRLRIISLISVLFLTLLGCASTPLAPKNPMTVRLIGHTTLPHKMSFQNTVVGGLSGIDYDAVTDTYYVVSDDRSDHSPARFYTAKIAFDEKSLQSFDLQSVVMLKQADGRPFPPKAQGGEVVDPEAIRYRPNTKTLLWTSEGDKRMGLSPFVREMTLAGQFIRALTLPEQFAMQPHNVLRGPRDNLTFEGLTLSSDQQFAWVSLEAPLYEDGDPAKVGSPSGPLRITQLSLATGKAEQQFIYTADAIPVAPNPVTGWADNGVVEILSSFPNRLLVLERAFSQGVGNSVRLYEVDVRDGSETLTYPTLRNAGARSVPKRLVVDFAALGLPSVDNIEAMSWGKKLPNGKRSLVFLSDDNFSARQVTQVIVLEVNE